MKPILRGALTFISTPYLQPIILLMIFPSVNNIAKAKKSFLLELVLLVFS
ncbi:hypothetical protein KHA80_05230 [Anaerobacillus sp. HL2]|nr:hypothetical protein KHA80_05230 [Anaerobacillus sp. HL2]